MPNSEKIIAKVGPKYCQGSVSEVMIDIEALFMNVATVQLRKMADLA